MANDYFTASGNPISNSRALSALVRAEFNLLVASFDKLPALTGNATKFTRVNDAASALTVSSSLTESSGNIGVGRTATNKFEVQGTAVAFYDAAGANPVSLTPAATAILNATSVLQINTGGIARMTFSAGETIGVGRVPSGGAVFDVQSAATALVRVRGGTLTNEGSAFVGTSGSDTTRFAIGQVSRLFGGTPGNDAVVYSAGYLAFAPGAAEKGRWTAADGLGIGKVPASGGGLLQTVGTVRVSDAASETNAVALTVTASSTILETRYATPLLFGTGAVECGRFDAAGNLGLNTTAPTNLLHLRATTNPVIRLESAAGDSGYLDYTTARLIASAGGGFVAITAGNNERARFPATGGFWIGRTVDSGLGAFQVAETVGSIADLSSSAAGTSLVRIRNTGAQITGLAIQNSATGNTSGDGFRLLTDAAGAAYVDQTEAQPLTLQTQSTARLTITSAGTVNIGSSSGNGSRFYVFTNEAAQDAAFIGANFNGIGRGLVVDGNTRTSADDAVSLLEVRSRTNAVALSVTVAGAVNAAGLITATTGFAGPGGSLTALNATQLTTGTVPDGRFPATLPAASGANLTALNASNVSTGTLANARTTGATAATANTLALRDANGDSAIRALTLGNTAVAGNVLDWYEEATFTPTISFGGASVGVTYVTQTGSFTRYGNLVSFVIRVELSSNGTSTGSAALAGLPYAAAATPVQPVPVWGNGFSGLTGNPLGNVSSSSIALWHGSTTGFTAMTETNVSDTAAFNVSGVYRVA